MIEARDKKDLGLILSTRSSFVATVFWCKNNASKDGKAHCSISSYLIRELLTDRFVVYKD